MTIQMPIAAATDPWPATQAAVNAWRGQCLAHLARAETAVSETLVMLAQNREVAIKLPHLIGQRCDELAKAIAPDGPFHAQGGDVREALDAYRGHASLRNFLCHAPGKITCDRSGRWVLVLRILTFRANRPERSVHIVEESESSELLDRLRVDCRRLTDRLVVLRKKLA
ncbi:MAG: hypothetical protein E7773_00050 [Sphingomonas sp.]|uniref:hypothetical protein n=1 Tax=Sphingomonas sp. TaxID=28214 RepID=UPI00121696D1|nr:hypothetical protein [Sphingomonas sp.]THD38190.1 MAG: hypothetical protein E7773_00050 [Sphingomonas sp.]